MLYSCSYDVSSASVLEERDGSIAACLCGLGEVFIYIKISPFLQLCGLNCFNNLYCRICALTWCMWAPFTGKVTVHFTELCFEPSVICSFPHQGLKYQCIYSDFLSCHCLWCWSCTHSGGSPSAAVNTWSLQSPMKVTRGPGGIADLVDRFRVLPRMPLVFLI